jgi:hypothetical protein
MIQVTALRKSVGAMIATLVLVAAGTNAGAAGLSGAIFTTYETGLFVNGNVYDHDDEVYLNGGPKPNAPCTAAGLPDGYYYFQVTDPSGKLVLSSDPIEYRQVQVTGGVIVGLGLTGTHKLGSPTPPQCGSLTVRLCPFAISPNGGEEYKVWMARVPDDPTMPFAGFLPDASKTDNFKVTDYDGTCPVGIPD